MPYAELNRYIRQLCNRQTLRKDLLDVVKNERFNNNLNIFVQSGKANGYSFDETAVVERIAPGERINLGWLFITEYPQELALQWHTVSGACHGVSFPLTEKFEHIFTQSSEVSLQDSLTRQEAIFAIAYITMVYDGVLETAEATVILEKMQLLQDVAAKDIASLWIAANRVIQIAAEKGLSNLFHMALSQLAGSEKLLAFQIALDVMAAGELGAQRNTFFLQALANALDISETKAVRLAEKVWFPPEISTFAQGMTSILYGQCLKVISLQPVEALFGIAYTAMFADGQGDEKEAQTLIEKIRPTLNEFSLSEESIWEIAAKIKQIADTYGLSTLFANARAALPEQFSITAFYLASRIVLADEIIQTKEQDFLVALSKALNLTEDDYQNIVADIIRENSKEKKRRFDEIFLTVKDLEIRMSGAEAIFAIGYIAMLCDGVALESEAAAIIEFMQDRELLPENDETQVWQWIARTQEISFNHGLGALFYTAKKELSGPLSEDAFRLAVEIIVTDQSIVESEYDFLIALADALVIPEERVHEIIEGVVQERRALVEYTQVFRTNRKTSRSLLSAEALLALGYLTIKQIGKVSHAAMGALLDTFAPHPALQSFKPEELWHLLSSITQFYNTEEAGGLFNSAKDALEPNQRIEALSLILKLVTHHPELFAPSSNFIQAMAKALAINNKKLVSLIEQARYTAIE
jgi:uncharacterized membrane protein YebE (DUF533 family)